jgi:hypothetical protein
MTQEQKKGMYAKIEKHGRDLLALFPNATIKDPLALCKALRRLEVKAHRAAENWCNTGEESAHDMGEACANKAAAILQGSGTLAVGVFFNGDARGYALKLAGGSQRRDLSSWDQNISIYKDWGGYGIIAPDFTPSED